MNLLALGLTEDHLKYFSEYDQNEFIIGRVTLEHKRMYRVLTNNGELLCEVSGRYSFTAQSRLDYPAVGDWVVIKPRAAEKKGTIHHLLPRKSKFSRKVAGNTTEEQIVATNVDTVFLVNSLNADLNLRRIERYILLAWESGASPVIILSKTDLCENVDEKINNIQSIALGIPIIPISVETEYGLEELTPYLKQGKTIALLGSSGVGKSTLANYLLGKTKQIVQEIREDDKGKHTTTHRELIVLPSGACLIDTPGMRELQLWESETGLGESFSDIEVIAKDCRFRDCNHTNEPGCAVQQAITDGNLSSSRLNNYNKLLKELAYLERKTDKKAQLEEKKRWKQIHVQAKKSKK